MKLLDIFFKKKKSDMLEVQKDLPERTYPVLMGNNSMLHPEAEVINKLNDKSAISIGDYTHVRGMLLVYPSGGKISIGNFCYIGKNTNIWSACNIIIEDNVLIAHDVDIFDHNVHPIDPFERREHYKTIITKGHPREKVNWVERPVHIKQDAWIGSKSIILKGVTIGRCSIVAAGSVVTKDVEDYTMVAGNPAKVIKRIDHELISKN